MTGAYSEDAVYLLIYKYLRKNNYFVSKKKLKLQLLSHPEYPSIKAVTDTLDDFDVDNIAVSLPVDSIHNLPDTFLAVMKDGEISLVNRQNAEVKRYSQTLQTINHSLAEFQNQWTGTVLAVEKVKAKKSFKFLIKYLPLLLLIIPLVEVFGDLNLYSFVWVCLSLIGSVFSFFIIKKDLGLLDVFVQKICDSTKTNVDCNAVINSKLSKLFGLISLGDLSFVFFLSSIAILGLLGFNYVFYVTFLTISLPIIVYSIYLQGVVIKKWCPLCLSISAVIIAMLSMLFMSTSNFVFDFEYWRKALTIALILVVCFYFAKSFLKNYVSLKENEAKFLQFKRNFKLFKAALNSNDSINTEVVGKLKFGTSHPEIVIDAVLNPTCKFCKHSFQMYYHLLVESHNENLQVNFIFKTLYTEPTSVFVTTQILNIYENKGKEEALEALKYWFEIENLDKWKLKYNDDSSKYIEIIKQHTNWCHANNVDHVPYTILNNHHFPEEYDLEDLSYFMKDLGN